jgi:hypothetical protein
MNDSPIPMSPPVSARRKRLPVSPGDDGGGHRGMAEERPADLGRAPGPPLERQRRVEAHRAGAAGLHVRHQAAGRRREGERILEIGRHERRDVQGLGGGGAKRARGRVGPQPVVVGAAEGVAHLREDDLEALGAIEAVEERDRSRPASRTSPLSEGALPGLSGQGATSQLFLNS